MGPRFQLVGLIHHCWVSRNDWWMRLNGLRRQSGLLGLSGISDDMRTLLESADPRAAEAVDIFCYLVSRELCSLAAALVGLDAVVFTGGIGMRYWF